MSEPAVATPWSLKRCFLFRFALLYFVLYALPFPLANLWQLCVGYLYFLPDHYGFIRLTPPEWVGSVYTETLGHYSGGWQVWTSWLGETRLFELDVFHQMTGSGDTAHALIKLIASTVFALAVAILWSLFEFRRDSYPRAVKWLHLSVRWYVGLILLGYGLIKLYSGQFPYPYLSRLLNTLGDTSPMGLLWTFMGFSKPYEVFVGIGEALAGLLLLWRGTSLLGCLIGVAVMSNVVALNWFYDVPVKLFSANLLLFLVALLAPDLKRLLSFFTNRTTAPADLRISSTPWVRQTVAGLGILWIVLHLTQTHFSNMQRMELRATERPSLYGIWEVEKMLENGLEIGPTDLRRWRYVGFDVRDSMWTRTITNRPQWFYCDENPEARTLRVGLPSRSGPPSNTEIWTFEPGTKTKRTRHPAPRTRKEASKMVDIERKSVIVRGSWRGKALELHLLRKQFRLERGFHLVQERPFNR